MDIMMADVEDLLLQLMYKFAMLLEHIELLVDTLAYIQAVVKNFKGEIYESFYFCS